MARNESLKIKAFDFFCGAGGLTRGLLNANINVLAGIDNDARLTKTYSENNKPSRFVCEDINIVDIHKLRADFKVKNNDIVLYAACAPCQPFSTLNRMEGKDKRKLLLLVFAEKILKVAPPDFLIVENVPGLGNAYGKEVYGEFLEILHDCGFQEDNMHRELLDAKHYGVPQSRKRFLLLASRHTKALPPARIIEIKTVSQAIGNLPKLNAGEKSTTIPNHEAKLVADRHLTIIKAVPKNGGSRSDIIDTSILLDCHRRNPTVHKDVFGRMWWDRPSPTLTCRCTDVYCGRFTHPEQDRPITLREAASLQSFDNDYEFFGSYSHIQRQIGNAVPVKLAEQVGKSIVASALTSY